MSVHLRQPADADLRRLLEAAGGAGLTYEPAGCSLDPGLPTPGMTRRTWHVELPGDDSFDRAITFIEAWGVQRGAGLKVLADGVIEQGLNVAMSAPLPLGHVDVTCRVVAVISEADQFAFAYGTLPVHPARGEEAFVVTRRDGGARFDIAAVSRVAHPLARLVPFIADRLQGSATGRYLEAMRVACLPQR